MNANSVLNFDFLAFTKLQVLTDDIDPAYPYIKYYVRDKSKSDKIKFILDYMSSYSLGSALYYYHTNKILMTENGNPLTGIERRGLRSTNKMLNDLSQNENRTYFVSEVIDRVNKYSDSVFLLQKMENYGRWAAFKLTEILDYVFELNWECDNLFTERGSGHTTGLQQLASVNPTEQNARAVFNSYKDLYEDYRYQNFETSLCDWHNLLDGKYYAGNDIDLLKEHLQKAGQFDAEVHKKLYPNYPTDHKENVKSLRKLYISTGIIKWWK